MYMYLHKDVCFDSLFLSFLFSSHFFFQWVSVSAIAFVRDCCRRCCGPYFGLREAVIFCCYAGGSFASSHTDCFRFFFCPSFSWFNSSYSLYALYFFRQPCVCLRWKMRLDVEPSFLETTLLQMRQRPPFDSLANQIQMGLWVQVLFLYSLIAVEKSMMNNCFWFRSLCGNELSIPSANK